MQDRARYRDEAVAPVAQSKAGEQQFSAPVRVLPYTEDVQVTEPDEQGNQRKVWCKHAFLQAAPRCRVSARNARARSDGPWQRLSNGRYWARSTDALLGVLLATDDAAVWLLWQQPETKVSHRGHWLR
ncbi:inner membrane CreD family protein [Xanthomonas oryzae pv. oryzicola]|uniref:Inner membrane protein n=1 Tax=Xanthomonas oryzae pv. oryzicola (strain BLS256) TaxID=383407 RepID=G7TKR4_XANOB|nr:inner membrane CreD family protein [Xanthomonas oryzae]AEQ95770.1 inner membrane protein [Xanthomonas oryzae pv. oryzicola BLS256]AJQ88275.1 membrane protein [Xanthomonas oryzae pv. oryzicola]AKK63469.1 membrane protein [Xanthomonas oryzae pv. oryzicola]AKN92831.1 membrane protein [Xanthomonas oryzae pv. oryzicola]AKN96561.1 membrane protein [Xanthomonas oryzae pv. oryzicola]